MWIRHSIELLIEDILELCPMNRRSLNSKDTAYFIQFNWFSFFIYVVSILIFIHPLKEAACKSGGWIGRRIRPEFSATRPWLAGVRIVGLWYGPIVLAPAKTRVRATRFAVARVGSGNRLPPEPRVIGTGCSHFFSPQGPVRTPGRYLRGDYARGVSLPLIYPPGPEKQGAEGEAPTMTQFTCVACLRWCVLRGIMRASSVASLRSQGRIFCCKTAGTVTKRSLRGTDFSSFKKTVFLIFSPVFGFVCCIFSPLFLFKVLSSV